MRKTQFLMYFVAVLFFLGCTSDNSIEDFNEAQNTLQNKSNPNKIDICHYDMETDSWKILNVNVNSWEEHSTHGDVRLDDQDNDGTVPNNECNYGVMGDCDDTNAAVSPLLSEILNNGIDDDCNPETPDVELIKDADGDGYNELEECDDHDFHVHPGATEILYNGIDDDCNPNTPDVIDADNDGFTSDVDCDDSNPTIYPGAPEICGDNIDQNCDGYDKDCSGGGPIVIK